MTDKNATRYAALILRLSLGIMFVAHGLLKVLVFTMPGTVAFFESLGLPGFMAYLVMLAEIGGGAALILGFMVRWVSLGLIPVLLGAAWVHVPNGWLFSADGGGWEYPVFLVAATVVQALLGAGVYAIRTPFLYDDASRKHEAA